MPICRAEVRQKPGGDMGLGTKATTYRRRVSSRCRRSLLRPLLRVNGTHPMARLGSNGCGWWVPESILHPGAVAYCAGAGEDISFDLELHRRGLTVVTLDPTPRAVAYVEGVRPHDERFHFEPTGLWSEPDELRFFSPADPSDVSHSIVNLQRTDDSFVARVDSLSNLMDKLGHDDIDLLKLDIEGAESRVLPDLLRNGPRPPVMCFEYDQPQSSRRLLQLLRSFRDAGYALAHVERWNFTLVRPHDRDHHRSR
jgi:FkbM family methyltransferase